MNSSEFYPILEKFENLKSLFIGTYTADKLPKRIKTYQFAILNTDSSEGGGLHWYCLYKYSSSSLEIFDSLGINTEKKEFISHNFKFPNIKEVEYNTTQFQKNDSISCGKFVLYFIINRIYNLDHSLKDILEEIFVKDLEENERKVEIFFQKLCDGEETDDQNDYN